MARDEGSGIRPAPHPPAPWAAKPLQSSPSARAPRGARGLWLFRWEFQANMAKEVKKPKEGEAGRAEYEERGHGIPVSQKYYGNLAQCC